MQVSRNLACINFLPFSQSAASLMYGTSKASRGGDGKAQCGGF